MRKQEKEKTMTIRKAKEIFPTMKIDASGDNSIPFKAIQGVIVETADVETKFGESFKVVLNHQESNSTFDVFVNNFSMQNLITAFGEDDVQWIGKNVELKKHTDKKYNKEMIVIHAVK